METKNIGDRPENPKMKLEFFILGKDFTSAGEASRMIRYTLQHIGFDASFVRRIATAAYEAEMNIVIHADSGTLLANIAPDYVEIVAEDQGPGIADISQAMQEGYSTATAPIREMGFGTGMGLPNMKKCADEFHLASEVGQGTLVRMVLYNKHSPGP
jgi:serine/threonine-protein kinase RsbT